MATNGDTHLGGEGFDSRLIDYLVEDQKNQGIDLRDDPLAMRHLKKRQKSENRTVSFAQQTDVNLPYITADATGPTHEHQSDSCETGSLVENMVNRSIEPLRVHCRTLACRI
ncbi:Hsp70 family protein [Shigella flexneri]